jgi:hypothetical protein
MEMPLKASRVTVGVTDTLVASPAKNQKATVTMAHNGSQSVFIGGSGVTVAQGFELLPGVPVSIEIDVDDEVHAIVASSTVDVSVLRID